MTAITDFLTRYAWAGPIIGAVFGVIGTVIYFLVAQYWQMAEFRLKDRTVTIQEVIRSLSIGMRQSVLEFSE
jgi:uncharacterized membrane protein